ncbi:ArsR family transcriptional regulator [Arthrobacter sp. MYb229]|uniref:arylsulfotransferase family protein n=1 Tax=unclassified Arthrobacter TaxID=235627 RepID=UPI000CFD31FD|nr:MULTISPECIES: arylsulfotransferase family protein [unclassified Arthrobacter]PRA04698.1 ArsR family transcriptional regulator [Arthrobacter sp. MYb229]PRB51388.1 ArsR family transcriptional regulator [Arthrobacter sp. MYb216]
MGANITWYQPRRRRASAAAIVAALAVLLSGCAPTEGAEDYPVPHHSFVSRPDLTPPKLATSHGETAAAKHGGMTEYIFLTPGYETGIPSSGAMIFDAQGELVWMEPIDPEDPKDNYFDLRPQEYRGETVLTVYQGTRDGGRGNGEILVLNAAYEQIASVTTGGSLGPGKADFHDSTITAAGTMLIASYVPTPADLSAVGGPEDGNIEDAVIQEVDIASGEVIFEWSALDHVPLTQTMLDFDSERAAQTEDEDELGTAEKPFDYFHINSITEDHDGAILVSARHTSAVYRLDRTTGEVAWTLGGSASDFDLDEDAVFAWQHDAQRAPDGTLTLLDNHAKGDESERSSRGLRLSLDERAMTASVVTEYAPPQERAAGSMANAQELANGNMLIGWGSQSYFSEYNHDGELLYDICHGDACYPEGFSGGGTSYRAYKAAWHGQPSTDPQLTLRDRTAYVSWNGATEVAQWRLLTGDDAATASEQATVERESFETAIPLPGDARYVVVEALDGNGEVLGSAMHQE